MSIPVLPLVGCFPETAEKMVDATNFLQNVRQIVGLVVETVHAHAPHKNYSSDVPHQSSGRLAVLASNVEDFPERFLFH